MNLTPRPLARRQFLKESVLGAAALGGLGIARPSLASSKPTSIEIRTISQREGEYCGWPTVARRKNGELIVAYSGRREGHVCPFGSLEIIRSRDNGQTWSWPRTVYDSPIDDRDAGILETASGALLITTFTSLAYQQSLEGADGWDDARRRRWQAVQERTTPEQRKQELGTWIMRSTDGGVTWSERQDSVVNSPHGPIQLADGRLLYPGKRLWSDERRIGVAESTDDGKSWNWTAEIPTRQGDRHQDYHELHGVEAADGTIVVHIRNHNSKNNRETLQSVSTDGGRTFSLPEAIGVWGLPSFLLRLSTGDLLMTYGHRRQPLGNQARISRDHGKSWSEPIIISGDGTSGDLGYPSTVELDDGSLVTVWYEKTEASPMAVLRLARWKI